MAKSLGLSADEMQARKRKQMADYAAKHIRQVQFTLTRQSADVLAWLDAQPSMQAAIKDLVRADKAVYNRHKRTARKHLPDKKITKIIGCDLERDRDVLEKLDNVDNRSDYIRDLIRDRIEKDKYQ